MNLLDLVVRTRSYRRFDQSYHIATEILRELVNLACLTSSARNAQALKYLLINTPEDCANLFPLIAWAGYLTDWPGPIEGERPTAYIVVLKDTTISQNIFCDDGLAIQSIMLGATEKGLGGCIIGSINKEQIRETLSLAEDLEVLYVLALGKPIEKVVLEEIKDNNSKYWRDKNGVHHVPKRELDELIILNKKGKI